MKVICKLSSARQTYLHIGKIIIGQITWSDLGHSSIQLNAHYVPSTMVRLEDGKTAAAFRVPILAGWTDTSYHALCVMFLWETVYRGGDS